MTVHTSTWDVSYAHHQLLPLIPYLHALVLVRLYGSWAPGVRWISCHAQLLQLGAKKQDLHQDAGWGHPEC